MNIIVVLVGNINKFPPTLSLLNALGNLGIRTVLITTATLFQPASTVVELDRINLEYENLTPVQKMTLIPNLRRKLWEKIDKYYSDDSVIWVVTDVTLKYLGYKLIGRRYVLQFLELSDKLVYYKKIPWMELDAKKLCNNALGVVVPEYNRAHIMKALWGINDLPMVLPNCPYSTEKFEKKMKIEDEKAAEILQRIGDRKIILYQGVISPERPLEPFIHAVDLLENNYAFVIMSGGKNKYTDIKANNFFYIPFVAPPGHLQITSHAYIGVLSYVPTSGTGYSVLNTLYCAPNKTYEFSQFGIPMIGNNNPGLRYLFETEGIGTMFMDWDEHSICKSIIQIEENYQKYSNNAIKYYKKSDFLGTLDEILNSILNQLKRA